MKKRIIAIIIAVVVLLAAGIVLWYMLSSDNAPSDDTVINEKDEAIYNSLSAVNAQKEYHFSAITTENAVEAIKMIEMADSFYAVFTAEVFGGGESVATKTKVWKNEDKYRTETQGSVNKTTICDGEKIKITNDDRTTYGIYPVSGEFSFSEEIGVADINYILENAQNEIISVRFARTAGIQTGGNIIYAEFFDQETGYREEFYISIDYGILLSAQTFMGDELIYRLTTNEFIQNYVSDGTLFVIND